MQLAIYGSDELDVTTILVPTLVLSHQGAPLASQEVDLDLDGHPDLLVAFATAAIVGHEPDTLYFGGKVDGNADGVWVGKDRDPELLGQVRFDGVRAAKDDADGDGVDLACDLCPTVAGPVPSVDGCP